MSIKLPLKDLSITDRRKIVKELSFKKGSNKFPGNKFSYGDTPEYVYPYFINEEDPANSFITLPFYWARKYISNADRPKRDRFPEMETEFVGKLRELQKEVKKEVNELLNKRGSCILSIYTGAGKTITSICIAAKIKLKCLIICHRLVLIEQWVNSIKKVCKDPKIQIVTAKGKLDETCDFYIMNAINIPKKGMEFFESIGTVIVDEVHLIATGKISECFNFIQPRYLLGLSATPYRPDGMDVLLDAYFGTGSIHRKMWREHYTFCIKTNLVPEFSLGGNGNVDWNSVLEWQTGNIQRNEMIIELTKLFRDRNFLILSKRVSQVEYLVRRLKEENEEVTSLVGVQKYFDYSSRILVATVQKAGVGFDHPKLDTLIIASDVEEYFIQYLGRIFRREDSKPIIFDFLDDFPILKRHWNTRKKVYREHGGLIFDYSQENVNKVFGENFVKIEKP
jgi:superfamily II DNA or RNA helicase